MIYTETEARTKFCPFMRGVAPLPDRKFSTGINVNAEGKYLQCIGSACAIWHQVGEQQETELKEKTKEKCEVCKADEAKGMKDCAACEGTGNKIKVHKIPKQKVGYCGGGAQISEGLTLEALTGRVDALVRVMAQDKGVKLDDEGYPILPGAERVKEGGAK